MVFLLLAAAVLVGAARGQSSESPRDILERVIATTQANAVRNRHNRLAMVNWSATRLTIPNTTNAPGQLWPTTVTRAAPPQEAS
eukprot:COSAG06_NODE_25921_length_626_cov_0.696395_1_plen_83_part_01